MYKDNFDRRKQRIRAGLRKKSYGKLRLTVHRSGQHMYAQIIDDLKGVTVVSASTTEKEFPSKVKTSTVAAAEEVGKLVAERAKKEKAVTVVFDRGGYLYHGRVKALAEGARKAGLKF
jgi:large subunit ribosomal protein L18